MGFFDGLSQPGPGVYADDQKEGAVIRFFRLFALRFFSICIANFFIVAYEFTGADFSICICDICYAAFKPGVSI